MRDMNQSLQDFSYSVRKFVRGKGLQCYELRDAVFVNPNLEYEVLLVPLPRKLDEIKSLIFISYFLQDRAFGFLIREKLYERSRNFSLEDRMSCDILLCGDIESILTYFYFNDEISSRTFFGNFLTKGIELCNQIKVIKRKLRKPSRPVWRRGYKDKGTLRPSTKWLPSFDYSFTEMQNEKERIQKDYQTYLSKILFFLKENSL